MASSFHEKLIEAERETLTRAKEHGLFRSAAADQLEEKTLQAWLAQEYLWLRDYERFLAELAARAPHGIRRPLLDALLTLHGDIELAEEFAASKGISQASHRPAFATHAYGSFLLATVNTQSFQEAMTVCFAANYSWQRNWEPVVAAEQQLSPWWGDFLKLWNRERFHEWVVLLGQFIDATAEETTDKRRQEMQEAFRVTLHYAIRFWDSVLEGADW